MKIKPMAIVLTMLAGLINRQQTEVIEYLIEENKILREKIGSKRILLNINQKRRLAVLGKKLGRKLLGQVCCAFSPDTTPFAERFVRSIKSECLDKMIIFGRNHLKHLVSTFCNYYHHRRPHQGLDNNMIAPLPQPEDGKIVLELQLGGLLKSYRRVA